MATKNEEKVERSIDGLDLPDVDDEIVDQTSPLELEVYVEWSEDLAEWAYTIGKDPEFGEGYSATGVQTNLGRIDSFADWVFRNDRFTTAFTHDHADAYWKRVLLPADKQLKSSRKDANAVQLIFKKAGDEWSIPNSESVYRKINKKAAKGFTDWYSVSELRAIKTASLRVYAIPDRESMAEEEEGDWAAHLAQRLRKPKHELTDEDWDTASSWKIPSLVYVSCDVGFRPIEVKRSRRSWFDLNDQVMRVAKDEDSKEGSDYWHCYLSDETTRVLQKWFDERDDLDKYDDTDAVWLTRKGNPYSADSLRRPIMHNLQDEATGIDKEERESGWYMIRRGVGTDIGARKDISKVMQQLRINNVGTAKRYMRHDERGMRDYFKRR